MEKFEALKEEFSKFLIHLEKTIDSIDIEHPFNTFVEFTFDRGQYKSGMLVNYDFVRMYDIFDEKIKSYIQTIKETDPKEFSPMMKDKVKILNIKSIQVNNQYRGQGHFKYMINQLENLCKKRDLYYKSVKLVMKS